MMEAREAFQEWVEAVQCPCCFPYWVFEDCTANELWEWANEPGIWDRYNRFTRPKGQLVGDAVLEAREVAEMFQSSLDGWGLTLNARERIDHVQEKTDPFRVRLRKAVAELFRKRPESRIFKRRWWHRFQEFKWSLEPVREMPDAVVSDKILAYWSEDAIYITLFQPRVGIAVLDFLQEHPGHPNAVRIREEIERAHQEVKEAKRKYWESGK